MSPPGSARRQSVADSEDIDIVIFWLGNLQRDPDLIFIWDCERN